MLLKEIEGLAGENAGETWINTRWRPIMAWQYMLTCICDFILFPILWTMVQILFLHAGFPPAPGLPVTPLIPWAPLTLQFGGLYHIAMGAIVGVSAWTRYKEKLGAIDAVNSVNAENKGA